MSSILSIAASGMAAASQRLQVSAENIANAESDGPLPSAGAAVRRNIPDYVPLQVDQVATPGGGTGAVVVDVQPAAVAAYAPTAPFADPNGEVAAPNVDYANEAHPAGDRGLRLRHERPGDARLFADDQDAARRPGLTPPAAAIRKRR